MKLQVFFTICALAAITLACNAVTINLNAPTAIPAASQPAPVAVLPSTSAPTTGKTPPVAVPTDLPPAVPPTFTPPPTETQVPTIAPSPTPSEPLMATIDKPVNCRFGPGMEYPVIGYLLLNETAHIMGKAADVNWWYIRLPRDSSIFCWVAASVTAASGNLSLVNVVSGPDVTVTDVSLRVDPTLVTVPGCVFPYSPVQMTGSITTNGPAIVEWHWETSQGNVTPSQMLKFTKFGTKTVTDNYKYGSAGTHWIKLVITSPNSKVVKTEYSVVCGP